MQVEQRQIFWDELRNFVGIDIGGTKIRVALGDESGKIIKAFREDADHKNMMDQIYGWLERFPEFEGIGVSAGGPLLLKKGTIVNPPNMEIRNLNIIDMLEKRFGKKSYLLNDCVAGVLAEKFFGAAKNYDNAVYLTLSTGIGAGVIANGKLVLGKDGNAHEVGHFLLQMDSDMKCGCGSYGHWEAYCGGKSIPNYVKHLLESDYKDEETPIRKATGPLTAKALFDYAKEDKIAAEITERIARINAVMIANIVNAYDPEIITIGGSIMLHNKELMLRMIEKHTEDYVINRMPEIKVTHLGEDTPLLGAIASVAHRDWIEKSIQV